MNRAVVIGSGMGGLASAVLLQHQGYAVTVLEQHYRPGGMLHRFHRPGAQFDTGFHYCGGIDPGEALGQCLRHLGVFDDLEFHPLDPDGFDRLKFPDLEFRVPRGWEAYQQRLIDTFPAEADSIVAVVEAMQAAADRYGLYRMRPNVDLSGLIEAEGQSVEEALALRVEDPRLKAVLCAQGALYGVPPAEAPFGLHALILDHFLSGAWSIRGGGDTLARAMVRKIKAGGGQVRLRTAATAIEVDGREARAVITADGERHEADLVISNLHPRLTLDLLPPGAVRKAYRTRVGLRQVGHAHLGVYLHVDGEVPELGTANLYRYGSWSLQGLERPIQRGDVPFYFATSPTEHAPQRRGGSTIVMVLSMPWREVAPWADTATEARPADYLAFKEEKVTTAVEALMNDFPTLRGRIRHIEGSTPLSTAHFTRSPNGAVYGHLHSVAQMGRNRPMPFLRVRNMALVGQGVGMPGVLGVTLSAYYAIGHLFDANALLSELKSA